MSGRDTEHAKPLPYNEYDMSKFLDEAKAAAERGELQTFLRHSVGGLIERANANATAQRTASASSQLHGITGHSADKPVGPPGFPEIIPTVDDHELAAGLVEERTNNASGMTRLVEDIADALAKARAHGRGALLEAFRQEADRLWMDGDYEESLTVSRAIGSVVRVSASDRNGER